MEDSDEEFGFTSKIYRLFFHMEFDWPCLSFDILRDNLGSDQTIRTFPHTAWFVSATQANEEEDEALDSLMVTKISNLQYTKDDDDAEDESSLQDAIVECRKKEHPGPSTRVRSMPQQPEVVATWSENGSVMIWDVSSAIAATNVSSPQTAKGQVPLIFDCVVDDTGYGLAWSKKSRGILAVGQDSGHLSIWKDSQATFVKMLTIPAHTASVEDIVFSPNTEDVLATCSCDGSIAIWDLRAPQQPTMKFVASQSDVNVIDWNTEQPNSLVSGDDNGVIKIWDLARLDCKEPAAFGEINYYESPICSIEWNPFDETEFAAACEDGRVTVWDLCAEPEELDQRMEGIPDQLLFEHFCEDPKELHYHPQIKGMIAITGASFEVIIPDVQENTEA